MVEACHRHLKNFGLYFCDLTDFSTAEKAIAKEVEAYNNRPRIDLGCAKPLQFLIGKLPELHGI